MTPASRYEYESRLLSTKTSPSVDSSFSVHHIFVNGRFSAVAHRLMNDGFLGAPVSGSIACVLIRCSALLLIDWIEDSVTGFRGGSDMIASADSGGSKAKVRLTKSSNLHILGKHLCF